MKKFITITLCLAALIVFCISCDKTDDTPPVATANSSESTEATTTEEPYTKKTGETTKKPDETTKKSDETTKSPEPSNPAFGGNLSSGTDTDYSNRY